MLVHGGLISARTFEVNAKVYGSYAM